MKNPASVPAHERAAYLEQLRRAYGSLTEPNWGFVSAAASRAPYRGVLEELAEVGRVDDDTDLNCDVCFTFVLHGEQVIVVKLSMVGPYAVVLHFGQDGLAERATLISSLADESAGPNHRRIQAILSSHGFLLVPADQLESIVPIALDGPDATLYSALFEPEGAVPWLP